MDLKTLRQQWQQQARLNRRLRGHDLIPQMLRNKLPDIGTLSDKTSQEITAPVKLFHPLSNWYWYVYEMDHHNQDTLYCYVLGDYVEHGTVSLLELEALNVRGLPLERDLYFKPQSLEAIKAWHQSYESQNLRHW